MNDWLWGYCRSCGPCLCRIIDFKPLEVCPRCNQTIRYSPFSNLDVPSMDAEEFKVGPNIYRKLSGYNIWSLEELSENIKWCVQSMAEHRKHLQRDVDEYRAKATPPVNAETRFIWRKDGNMMHLTLIHPMKDGTEDTETIGTDPDKIFEAKGRIEAARWLKQSEEDLAAHIKREESMRKHLEAIANIIDGLDYSDKFRSKRKHRRI